MDLITNLHGRLKNTALPLTNGLLPVFESVSNAIHAIEDARVPMAQGSITLEVVRNGQTSFAYDQEHDSRAYAPIADFRISDNGIGFTESNMNSFLTLDSQYKAARGGRGVGRLLWLKAFARARIRSVFLDNETSTQLREFTFDLNGGISNATVTDTADADRNTCITLESFNESYRVQSPKTNRVIANNLLAHCLWYFVRPGGAPRILVVDGDDRISLDELYEQHMMTSARTETIELNDVAFELVHIKLAESSSWDHSIAFCASNRLVKEESIKGKVPGLFGALHDEGGSFVYQCYVSSPLLDERVRSERTSFDIEEEPMQVFAATELSFKEIRNAVLERAAVFLDAYLEEKRALGKERIESFVTRKAPRYRPILARIPDEELAIDPELPDKELDLLLHKHLAQFERDLLDEGHEIMVPQVHEDSSDYRARLANYLAKVEDIKRSDLANYISHRRVVIDLFEMATRRQDDGTYAREDMLHGLIMPMRRDSTEVSLDSCNLWLIDERLAFHDYLASDKRLDKISITGSDEAKEPDIVGLRTFDNPILTAESERLPPASLVVIELKRPMRNDARQGEEKDPIEQALGYLDRIRKGEVTTTSGRPIPRSDHVPGFCYVLCDLTPSIKRRCRLHDAIRTSDGLGYFFYNKAFSAYVTVMSYDQLLNSAKERNRAFFDKLGLPSS